MKPPTSRSSFAAAILTATACLMITAITSRPPSPKLPDPAGVFSATSAIQVLTELYDDGLTHPIGSNRNRLMKEGIVRRLRDLGYEPVVQRAFVCRASRACGHVENILARLEGTGDGPAVLLADHYDSVGAGPSVSDDGVAVAISLEVARLLKEGPPPANDVIFLIDDGEETGLLGAIAFATKHPWAAEVGAVVNLEARGTAGRSYMFETGSDNAWLVELMKRGLPHPATSSLFYSIYQRLPNDTDFTIFKEHGMNGVNFAFIDRVVHYHTPLDDLRHVTPATVQHQGENALGMVRVLADADLGSPPPGAASWFSLWGFGLLSWPEGWNLPLAILALTLSLVGFGIRRQRRNLGFTRLLWGTAAYTLSLVGAIGLGAAAAWLLSEPAALPAWPANPAVPKTAFWILGIALPALVIGPLGRRSGAASIWIGGCLVLAGLASVTAVVLPGAAYIFLVPALAGGVMALLTSVWRPTWLMAMGYSLTIVAASATQLVLAWDLWEALGITALPLTAFLVAAITSFVLSPAADTPRTGTHGLPWILLALAIALLILTILLPAYSSESPRPLNLYFVQDADTGVARMLARQGKRPLPATILAAIEWNEEPEPLYPWLPDESSFRAAPVPPLALSPPTIEVIHRDATTTGRKLQTVLRSPRHADQAALVFHEASRVISLRIDGWDLDLGDEVLTTLFEGDLRIVSIATFPEEGIEVHLEIEGSEPLPLTLLDSSFGLPSAAGVLERSRPGDATPVDRGDRTLVHIHTDL